MTGLWGNKTKEDYTRPNQPSLCPLLLQVPSFVSWGEAEAHQLKKKKNVLQLKENLEFI